MLTIKAPIEIKSRTDFIKERESFNERIMGNYGLMGMEIGSEELLHIVTTPPEIYIAEGEMTTVSGNTVINSKNEEKLNIINNALNRILISVDTPLTYQDRTYITDVLCKMGIRDDRKFMNEVRRIINETALTDRFISDYLIQNYNANAVETRRETLELSREIVEKGLAEGFSVRENYLGRDIMERLQTGAIYQIVANFNRSLYDNRIEGSQYLISEQENTAKQLLVNNFLETMEREGARIILREEERGLSPEEADSLFTERLTERYREGAERTERRETVREREDRVLSERELASEIERTRELEERLYTEGGYAPESETTSLSEIRETLSERSEERTRERVRETIAMLRESMLSPGETQEEAREEAPPTELIYREEKAEREEAADEETAAAIRDSREFVRDKSDNIYAPESETTPLSEIRETLSERSEERTRERVRETVEMLRESMLSPGEEREETRKEAPPAELIYREEERQREEGIDEETAAAIRDIREFVRYKSDNIYEKELIEENKLNMPVTEEVTAAVFIDMVKNLYHSGFERIRQGDSWFDIRNALFQASENTFNRVSFQAESSYSRLDNNTLYENISPVSMEMEDNTVYEEDIYEGDTTEQQIRALTRINENNIRNLERYQQMMSILRETQKAEERKGGPDRTRRDALRALEGNEDIRRLFDAEDEEREERKDRVFHEIERLFPENTKEVFNIIEKYMANPDAEMVYANVISNNLAEAAEEIRRFQERAEAAKEPEQVIDTEISGEELVFRRNETISREDIEEAVRNVRSNTARSTETIENNEIIRENTIQTVRNVTADRENFTLQQIDDITDMVSRGVKSQMNTISEQVLQKLEKRLRNEKSRRGI